MPLLGERRDKPTYIDLREISDGSNQLVRCSHRVLGADGVQKTVPIGSGGCAFAEPRLLEALDHSQSLRFGKRSSTPTVSTASRS